MASTYVERGHYAMPETPERALEQIQSERRRKGVIAAALFAAAVVAGLGFVYLAYNDVPAPSEPANANPGVVTPYR